MYICSTRYYCVIIKVKVKNFKKDLDKIENNVVDEQ